jgi:Fe-S cluster assembly scaffold protein SufB
VTASPLLAAATEATARQLSRDLEEPEWLLDERLDAVQRVAELPDESNTLWTTYLDLRPIRFDEVTPHGVVGRGRVQATAEAAPLPEGAAALVHIADGQLIGRARAPQATEAGVFVGTFAEALADPHIAPILRSAIEGGRSIAADDRFGQVSRALASIGVFIHVPDGVELEGPIVVRWSVAEPGRALVGRTVVVLGERARAGLLEELEGPDAERAQDAEPERVTDAEPPTQNQWWGTTEAVLGDGAALDVAGLQDFGPSTVGFVSRTATAGRDAALTWALAHVGGAWSKSRIDNHLLGQGSSVHQAEIAFGGTSQIFDLSSYTHHVGTDTTGDLLSKGVFQDRARAYIKGLIRIDRSAHGTDSYLGEFGMLLAKKARSVTIPSLEIDQPDVRRASHASSVAPIDEGQVFYAMTRGLSQDEARKAITLAFLEPVVARIPLPDVQERLRARLELKWVEAHGGSVEGTGSGRVLTGSTAA